MYYSVSSGNFRRLTDLGGIVARNQFGQVGVPDAPCIYRRYPEDTGCTVLDFPHWEPFRSVVRAFFGDISVTPDDVLDLLFGYPSGYPTCRNQDRVRNDKLTAASTHGTQFFYSMVENILCRRSKTRGTGRLRREVNRLLAA
ncbi:Hypothetical protein CINCED_3A009860 [Cinara cedri]|uniref:Uncharacterized protein n=1 Tax=Cinara cedri TaxID=506608 RepID=A0A5E4NBG0_9HEMI|nr:Hypothetical protein CINCED_3A009860 [Cinara cedri]